MTTERRFHWADYLVFAASLLLSSCIGIYYNIRDRNKPTTSEYLMGGRDMSILPVAASMVVSLTSAIFVQGLPAEVYSFGAYALAALWGFPTALFIAANFYLPVFHRLQVTSAYEYLERRYNKTVRVVCSGLSMVQMIVYSSVALYAPTIAISQATGLSIWGCILLTALICTFYTTLGGYKTVLWTDTLQCGLMFLGMIATLFKGAAVVGGFERVLNISRIGDRMNLKNLIPDPQQRHTIWDALWGDVPTMVAMYATSQFAVQRFCSIRNLTRAKLALFGAIPIKTFLVLLGSFIGLVAFAYFYGCDPLAAKRIGSRDQILSLLVMEVFKDNPGMAGVFLSSILSAALSTLSSVQNSFAAMLLEDFLKPIHQRVLARPMKERTATLVSKIVVFLVGVTITCLSLVVSKSGKLIVQLSMISIALGSAPILGIFSLGLFCPFANTKGAYAGLAAGVCLIVWVAAGSLSIPKLLHKTLPVSTGLCQIDAITTNSTNSTQVGLTTVELINTTISTVSDVTKEASTVSGIFKSVGISKLYRVSYKLYTCLGAIPALVVGMTVSLLTGGWKNRKQVKEGLLFSWRIHGYKCCKKPEEDEAMEEQMDSLMFKSRDLNNQEVRHNNQNIEK